MFKRIALAALLFTAAAFAAEKEPYSCLPELFTPAAAARWTVELPASDTTAFTIADGVLKIRADLLKPAHSTVRTLLPGDGGANGNVWARNKAEYVSFLVRANHDTQMSFHLLVRGKTAGTYQTGFTAAKGDWQSVVLPIDAFKLRNFNNVAGFGVRTAAQAPANTTVEIKDVRVFAIALTEDVLRKLRTQVSLSGEWKFKTDAGEEGTKGQWFAPAYNDSAWQTLVTGKSWQSQGVNHHGWGWYRKSVKIPAGQEGQPLLLNLADVAADDEVWFNGVRVGGWSSEYKYNNIIPRSYVVPANLVKYGAENSIALRIWGGNISFIGDSSGFVKGPLNIEIDPLRVRFRAPGTAEAVPPELFDLSEAQRGMPFEMVFNAPPAAVEPSDGKAICRVTDATGLALMPDTVVPIKNSQAILSIPAEVSKQIYLAGRINAAIRTQTATGQLLYSNSDALTRLCFTKRDTQALPALAERIDDTPYGRLRLIDEIDCAMDPAKDPHPYMRSGFDNNHARFTPGIDANVYVTNILGRNARESGYGWFAYRLGRGKLKPRATYLVRIEYPEDKPRFVPVELQAGQNYMDIGWKNGVGKNDVYDNWPLSGKWEWFDTIIPLDNETTGTGGTGSANAENGFWLYFMNKLKPNAYYAMWDGGPAIARIRLYEIDPERNLPVIRKPKGLPERVLALDWERGADCDPEDFVRYAKLMGYNAISPIIIKWAFANYGEPQQGYETVAIDARNYWCRIGAAETDKSISPVPNAPTQHRRFLDATRKLGIQYIPRFEWGGSSTLPEEAKAIDSLGALAKPNRFNQWCSNILHPATWDDLKKLMEHMIKPYVKDNPQLTGAHWRIRCNRVPISYGVEDLKFFAKETGTKLPPGSDAQWRAWAVGEGKAQYDTWWHGKRAAFHAKLAELLRSYNPNFTLYYFNWDADKFGIIEPDITAWGFVKNVVQPLPAGGRAAYEKERAARAALTAEDYIYAMRSGDFGRAFYNVNRADIGIRPELYANIPGIQVFAPANYLCYVDKPAYLNYFKTADGVAVSHVVSYDEIASRTINPKYEGNMIIPGGPNFSMALELLSVFHTDARTLNYTVYTYGRGFADAHRRFAQAYLAIPALTANKTIDADADTRVRLYNTANGTYVQATHKGYAAAQKILRIPGDWKPSTKVTDLVTGEAIPSKLENGTLILQRRYSPMQLDAYLIN